MKTKLSISNRLKIVVGNERLIELQGHDEYFYKFGISMTRFKPSSQKKIMASDWVLKNNIWFLNRIVFGANTRADINSIKMNQLESTPYSISKRFKQSYSSIHGIWKDLIYAQELGLQIS